LTASFLPRKTLKLPRADSLPTGSIGKLDGLMAVPFFSTPATRQWRDECL
jgi:hypothetical protein